MRSINRRITVSFLLINICTVAILEFMLINIIKNYYYNSVKSILSNQIKISSNFYSRYFSDDTLDDIVTSNIDVFWKQTNAEVQIVDKNGKVLMDSIGVLHNNNIDTADFIKALSGEQGDWIGNVDYSDSKILAVSYPLVSNNKVICILRFVTSLSSVDEQIRKISIVIFLIGLSVVILVGLISLFMARSIVEPIKALTVVAEKMAAGNFNIKGKKRFDDEIGQLTDTLNYMSQEIVKREMVKNEFIASISHELRTPLTIIKGWAITLNDEDLKDDDVLKDGLLIIETETERLTTMVEELLDFSKFVSGRVSLTFIETDIGELIKSLEKYLTPRAQREKLSFVVNIDGVLPCVAVDPDRIKQVLINILDNAFKFTDMGGTISLHSYTDDRYLFISIQDSGCGISEEELPRVKEKFYKGKNRKSSTGIGLALTDEIVTLHGGEVLIESTLGVGTKVTVKIPIKRGSI